MTASTVRIGTRGSPLALAQAREVRDRLTAAHPDLKAPDSVETIVIRTTGDDHEPRMFTTWAPIAIAMIGRLPGTLEDRSLAIKMRRKRPDESVARFRLDQANLFHGLAGKCARFVSDNRLSLKSTDPDIPKGLHDRAADNWRPLFAIADTAGGEWPELARRIALKLSAADEDANSASTELLTDIQKLFEDLAPIPQVNLIFDATTTRFCYKNQCIIHIETETPHVTRRVKAESSLCELILTAA